MYSKKVFTLTEMIIVVVIIAILAALALPLYRTTVLRARDREAKAMLRLIKEAEKIYRLEYYTYWPCTDTADCNADLRLDLPSQHWTYSVPTANQNAFCAQARRGSSSWRIRHDLDEPEVGSCP